MSTEQSTQSANATLFLHKIHCILSDPVNIVDLRTDIETEEPLLVREVTLSLEVKKSPLEGQYHLYLRYEYGPINRLVLLS